jgi:hypothetical protein
MAFLSSPVPLLHKVRFCRRRPGVSCSPTSLIIHAHHLISTSECLVDTHDTARVLSSRFLQPALHGTSLSSGRPAATIFQLVAFPRAASGPSLAFKGLQSTVQPSSQQRAGYSQSLQSRQTLMNATDPTPCSPAAEIPPSSSSPSPDYLSLPQTGPSRVLLVSPAFQVGDSHYPSHTRHDLSVSSCHSYASR